MYKNPEDQKAAQRKHYEQNKDLYKQRAKESRARQVEQNKNFIREYLMNHPCVDCGNSDVRVLQFDHRDPKEKRVAVARLINSRGLLEKEIAKCDVTCANCHMIRTQLYFGWDRSLWHDAPLVKRQTRST